MISLVKEEDFISQLKRKNPKALDYMFESYGNFIFKVAYSVLNNRQLSEECVNDVLLKIWNNIDSFNKGPESFKGWVIVISKYTAIDILRREKKHDNLVDLDFYDKETLVWKSYWSRRKLESKF